MDKLFHPTLYNGCNYLSILGWKLIHVCKRSFKYSADQTSQWPISHRRSSMCPANFSHKDGEAIGDILQMQLSNVLFKKMFVSWFTFYCSVPLVKLQIDQHWFRQWFCTGQPPNHYLSATFLMHTHLEYPSLNHVYRLICYACIYRYRVHGMHY